ncbi:MAG TPA: cytochrome c peroxidase [Thermoanaerobaculia bacterium]|nr:cytochrome c peroxidase [Thermoanaerobaculia bacterium]
MSAAKFELGRRLFYDVRLSGNGTQSCGSCHQQRRAFTDGRATAIGSTGEMHRLNTMTLSNVAYNAGYGWSGEIPSLEKQARVPMFGSHPVELGMKGREREIVRRLAADPLYDRLFRAAFPGQRRPVRMKNTISAIATFERALISGRSPYDRLVFDDDLRALSESAMEGMKLFFSARSGCATCHGGFNFSGPIRRAGAGRTKPLIVGNGITGGSFRVPTLRNIELTAPYMHDGSIGSLPEVIDRYDEVRRLALRPAEKASLIEFLESLTDEGLVTDQRFADPWKEE